MRIRFALGIGALLLAGGAVTGGAVAFAAPDAPPTTQAPAGAPAQSPTDAPPAPSRTGTPPAQAPTDAPSARPSEPGRQAPAPRSNGNRVPSAVPAGPTGDLHLPAVWG
ncbi:hypothetical protein [Amycolatopsis ultiminotia]|uniref:hypothetical protein n=1 Tax=Amycolatopsis ultiminotia TaxID=543629 RepID=UPI0031E7634C